MKLIYSLCCTKNGMKNLNSTENLSLARRTTTQHTWREEGVRRKQNK